MSDQNQPDIDHALDAWTPMEPPADFVDRVLAARAPVAPVRSRRAWLLAAPIAAAAMIVIVLFAVSSSSKEAASPAVMAEGRNAVATESVNGTATPEGTAGSGSSIAVGSAAVAMNQPVADAGVVAQPTTVDDEPTDIAIPAGTSVTVHDPAPNTVLHVEFGDRCATGATVTMFRTGSPGGNDTATASGQTRAVFTINSGAWSYDVRCASDPNIGTATGTIHVDNDRANRPLSKAQTSVPIYIGKIASHGMSSRITVTGAVQPGWTLTAGGAKVPIDARHRFSATVIGFSHVVIRAEHPQRGVHYFVTLPITK